MKSSDEFNHFRALLIIFFLCNAEIIFWRLFSKTSLLFDQLMILCVLNILCFMFIRKRFTFLSLTTFSCYVLTSVLVIFQIAGNVDRSRSLYVLAWVQEGKIVDNNDFKLFDVKSKEAADVEAIRQRVLEHKERKLVAIDTNGLYKLTVTGRIIVYLANKLSVMYSLQGWNNNKY